MTENKRNGDMIGGVVMAGCMIFGAGIGMIFEQGKIGGAIGLGIGLIAMGVIRARYLDK